MTADVATLGFKDPAVLTHICSYPHLEEVNRQLSYKSQVDMVHPHSERTSQFRTVESMNKKRQLGLFEFGKPVFKREITFDLLGFGYTVVGRNEKREGGREQTCSTLKEKARR